MRAKCGGGDYIHENVETMKTYTHTAAKKRKEKPASDAMRKTSNDRKSSMRDQKADIVSVTLGEEGEKQARG